MKKWWSRAWRFFINRPARKALEPQARPSPEPGAEAEQQGVAFHAIRWYGRRKARREIEAIHRRLVANKPEGALARQLRRLFPGERLR